MYAHRAAYILHHGKLPDGGCVLHTCDNPPCCNPAHLRAGTQTDNLADMRKKGRGTSPVLPGSSNPRAVITEEQALEIARLARDGVQARDIVKQTGVDLNKVCNITRGLAWSKLTGITPDAPIRNGGRRARVRDL